MSNILQATILTDFLYPLLLMFLISYAILQKTKILGDGAQLNAGVSLVIALIFVAGVFPQIITENLIQYMTIGLITIFVGLALWGFVSGNKDLTVADGDGKKIHKIFVFLLIGSLIFATLWATGLGGVVWDAISTFLKFAFGQNTGDFWTNALVIGIIFIVVLTMLGKFPPKLNSNPWIKLK